MALEYYDILYGSTHVPKQPIVTKSPEEVSSGLPLIEDAKDITLAQFEPITKDFITAHKISDYRRKTFNLRLLPSVEILFDQLLGGCDYYEKQLHITCPYS